MIIHHHLGLGDHFICNGLVNYIANNNDNITLICKKRNYATVKSLYIESKIKIHAIDAHNEIQETLNYSLSNNNEKILFIGFQNCNPLDWDRSFYKQVNIDFSERYNSFRLPKKLPDQLTINSPYIFIHNQSSDKVFDLKKIKSSLPKFIVEKKQTNNLLSYINLINGAEEVHCIDSSFYHLIDSMDKKNNLYYHDIRKYPYSFKVSSKWEIIKYDN